MALIGVVSLAILKRHEISTRLPHALKGGAWAFVSATIVLAYPIWFLLFGPAHVSGPVQLVPQAYRADFLGPIIPDSRMLLTTHHLTSIANNFAGSQTENGSYLLESETGNCLPECTAGIISNRQRIKCHRPILGNNMNRFSRE